MKAYKRRIKSDLLNRLAHADVFELGTDAKFLFVLFGGSGVGEEEYERRGHSVIPTFTPLLEALDRRSLSLTMVHVCAPYDVPLNRFAKSPSAADAWNTHVLNELVQPWAGVPYFVSGFSGGAALALNGLHRHPCCFGGGALGADALPPAFECPAHWSEKLQLYAARDDRVCNDPANREIALALVSRGQADLLALDCGEHRLADYASPDGLGDLLRFAHAACPSDGRG